MRVIEAKGEYTKIAALTERWLSLHKGETFDLDLICRQLNITDVTLRDYLTQKLSYEVRHGKLEKSNRIYRYINKDFSYIDILNSNPSNFLNLDWVKDLQGNDFNLRYVKLFPKATITLAGEKDNAKTAFCLNFMAENMDKYTCVYHTNEMSGEELVERMGLFDWVHWYKEDGTPKFIAVEQFQYWQDVVREYPDAIHIIDYLDPGANAYNIGEIISEIRNCLGKGMALISIQKRSSTGTKKDGSTFRVNVDYGIGGQFSEHKARLVIHMQGKNELFVKICKAWHKNLPGAQHPAGRLYRFNLINGARFTNIREITTDIKDEDFNGVYRGGD